MAYSNFIAHKAQQKLGFLLLKKGELFIIYIISKNGKALMPTKRYGHIRKLLKQNKAVVINNNPFTVRLKLNLKLAIKLNMLRRIKLKVILNKKYL